MLEQAFQDVYTKFKLHFYQNVFQRFATREATLTTVSTTTQSSSDFPPKFRRWTTLWSS